jgi:predicted PurR-regulated permease PerM
MTEHGEIVLKSDLRRTAAVTAVVIGMIGAVYLLHALIDIVIVFFLGIVAACALQPWHSRLCRVGVPKGLAVLLIYLAFGVGIGLMGLVVVPVVIEEVAASASAFPERYASFLGAVRGSSITLLRIAGQRLPPFEVLARSVSGLSGSFFAGALEITTGTVSFFAYFVSVLAIGFYWTLEVPRFERLMVSLLPVGRRAQTLNAWHEIEFKLGAFIRGQALAMLVIGVASGVGYFLIGLPNVLVLALLAGLFEAVPVIGPILAAVPAVIVALPQGVSSVALVVGFSGLVQFAENNWLIPRIMGSKVGVNALVGLLAILAFGALYGILGVFIAIPVAAVIQVILDRSLLNVEPAPQPLAPSTDRLAEVRARVLVLKQQMRSRLRERESRMGIDPEAFDHVMDAVDQEIEQALERIEAMMAVAPQPSDGIVGGFHEAAQHVERAKDRVDTIVATVQEGAEAGGPTVELPVRELGRATRQVGDAVERVESGVGRTMNSSGPIAQEERKTIIGELEAATNEMKQAVSDVDVLKESAARGAETGGSKIEVPIRELSQTTRRDCWGGGTR